MQSYPASFAQSSIAAKADRIPSLNTSMLVLNSPADTCLIEDTDIRELVELRFRQCFPDGNYEPELHGYFVVVQPGDTAEALEAFIKLPILNDPHFEVLEAHYGNTGKTFYEMLFVVSDDGFGFEIFIPATNGIDPALLSLCAKYATPAVA